ncbi:MAG: alkaline phosphatase, partial [Flavobacteriales bacterium]
FADIKGAGAAAHAFAKEDRNTLVIVTADHETGGLSLTKGNMKKKRISGEFSTKGHSGILVPVFAFGPNSESFMGIYDNTSIFKKMKALVN